MRKTIKTDREVEMLIPVWHTKAERQLQALDYDRPMVRFVLPPGSYDCENLEKWVLRGADVSEEDQNYLASLGFVPGLEPGDYIEGITSGLDPDHECN